MKRVNFQASLPVSIIKEGKRFVAYSPALDLSTSGKSHAEARRRFAEASQIFFEEIMKAGTFEKALTELGWKKRGSHLRPPLVVSQEAHIVKVPA
jgi:predicted RNase H-like HicB family nuclease